MSSGSNNRDAQEKAAERQLPRFHDINEQLMEYTMMEGDVADLEEFIGQGADVNYINAGGSTPAHVAAVLGSLEALKCFSKHGANMNAMTSDGVSPLTLAIRGKHLTTIRFLIEDCRVDLNDQHLLPICEASSYSNYDILDYLIHQAGADVNASNSEGKTPLHLVCSVDFPNVRVTQLLLEAGADVTARDNTGNTPLISLAKFERPICVDDYDELIMRMMMIQLMEPVRGDTHEDLFHNVQLMANATNVVNCTNFVGETAIHYFAERGNLHALRCFLIEDIQADVNITDNEGTTPIMRAFFGSPRSRAPETIRYFINDAGANVLCRSIHGETTLTHCLRRGYPDDIFEMLCHRALAEAGGRTTTRALDYFRPALVSEYSSASRVLFLVKNILGDATRLVLNDSNGNTALHTIFRDDFWGDVDLSDVILCLVEEGKVDMLATNHDGLTAVQLADEIGDTQSVNTLKGLHQKKIMKMLHFLNSLNWFPDRVNSNNSIAV